MVGWPSDQFIDEPVGFKSITLNRRDVARWAGLRGSGATNFRPIFVALRTNPIRWADSKNRMQRSYLLDTSAFRAVPAARLGAVSQETRLLVSPFCFWELLTHLEDEGQFDRVKGNLMKFRHVSVLDDPLASIERDVVLRGDAVHERPDDSELIYATLAALRDSASLSEFYAKHIRDDQNQVHRIAGCVARVRDVLKTEEQLFQEYVTKLNLAIAKLARAAILKIAEGELDLNGSGGISGRPSQKISLNPINPCNPWLDPSTQSVARSRKAMTNGPSATLYRFAAAAHRGPPDTFN